MIHFLPGPRRLHIHWCVHYLSIDQLIFYVASNTWLISFIFQVNHALKKSTRQSSTSWSGYSSRATDGNANGRYFAGHCTHTHHYSTRRSWLYVDLGAQITVTAINMYNRFDCCSKYRWRSMISTTSICISPSKRTEQKKSWTNFWDDLLDSERRKLSEERQEKWTTITPIEGKRWS